MLQINNNAYQRQDIISSSMYTK